MKIGEYLGQFESAFCMKVLSLFVQEFDFAGLRFDKAVRKLLTFIKVPGNPDRVEKIMEAFVKRFVKCNNSQAGRTEGLVVLACSIIQLVCVGGSIMGHLQNWYQGAGPLWCL